jgi:hypothetical protein
MKKIINLSLVIFLLAGIFSIGLNSAYAKEAKKANNITAIQASSKANIKSNKDCYRAIGGMIVIVPCPSNGSRKLQKKGHLAPKSTTELAANAIAI